MTERSDRPSSRRRPDWRLGFLEVIRSTGNVRLAASAVGISRSTPYARATRDPKFAAAWAEAEQESIDLLEGEARRRALAGSDALLMFLLRAHRPERYRQAVDVRFDVRREAERVAARLGISVDEVMADANRRIKELEA